MKTYTRNDTQISAAVGETIGFELQSNPTTGYRWIAGGADESDLVRDEVKLPSAEVGGGSVQQFELCFTSPGKRQLTFQYRRQWESTAVDSVTVEVDVS